MSLSSVHAGMLTSLIKSGMGMPCLGANILYIAQFSILRSYILFAPSTTAYIEHWGVGLGSVI